MHRPFGGQSRRVDHSALNWPISVSPSRSPSLGRHGDTLRANASREKRRGPRHNRKPCRCGVARWVISSVSSSDGHSATSDETASHATVPRALFQHDVQISFLLRSSGRGEGKVDLSTVQGSALGGAARHGVNLCSPSISWPAKIPKGSGADRNWLPLGHAKV